MYIFNINKSHNTVTVRMNCEEHKALRAYMHTEDGEQVGFPRNVQLNRQGFGWYKLVSNSEYEAVGKLRLAINILYKAGKEFKARTREDAKAKRPGVQVRAYVSEGEHGRYVVESTQPQLPQLASVDAIHDLIERFAHR